MFFSFTAFIIMQTKQNPQFNRNVKNSEKSSCNTSC